MQQITLLQVPNQTFNILLDNQLYEIEIRFVINLMTMTIIRDGVTLLTNIRIVPNRGIIPYEYLENGNFAFVTTNQEYPIYTQFEINQFLVYGSITEIGELRAST